jgi:hypothetical protein
MATQRTVFSQIIDVVHRQTFSRCVDKFGGNGTPRKFSCRDQFLAMAFAQITYRESLRDIEFCLGGQPERLYRMGFRHPVKRSTLADANATRDWRMWEALARTLISRASKLYAEEPGVLDLDHTVYALDSTVVDLCLTLFPWAHFRSTKSAIKLHTLLDLRGNIPTFIDITAGNVHDVNALDSVPVEPTSLYIMDRGYLDFGRLNNFERMGASFIIRAKRRLAFRRHCSRPLSPEQRSTITSDQEGVLINPKPRKKYPGKLRRIRVRDPESGKVLVLLSNNLELPANTIAELFRKRWEIEIFFKWIKQNLRIKRFYGNTPNAVHSQIWIAISVYLMIAILRKELKLSESLHRILQLFSVSVFEQVTVNELIMKSDPETGKFENYNQLELFEL